MQSSLAPVPPAFTPALSQTQIGEIETPGPPVSKIGATLPLRQNCKPSTHLRAFRLERLRRTALVC